MARKSTVRKITVALDEDLVEFADQEAARNNTSRSQIISLALARARAEEEERLAAEGYRFYSEEALEFAEASAKAFAEAISSDDDETW